MNQFYMDFSKCLGEENKDSCILLVLKYLEEGKISIPELYDNVITPSLNGIGNEEEKQCIQVWKEHVRSSIVRSVIECCYPYVIKERDKSSLAKGKGRVLIICPDGENHELGARMASDFFTIAGYESVFIGRSTPSMEVFDSVGTLRPKYVAISVTNYYNLFSAQKTIEYLRKNLDSNVVILAGGHAFTRNQGAYREIGADMLVNSFLDICNLEGGVG